MKTANVFLILAIFLAICLPVLAQQYGGQGSAAEGENSKKGKSSLSYRPGLEVRKIGALKVLVPEDGRVYTDEHGRSVIESAEEYAARRFKDVEKRFEKVELTQEKILERIKEIETLLKQLEIRHEENLPVQTSEKTENTEETEIPQ